LSSAFGTVDQSILLQRLQTKYNISNIAHRYHKYGFSRTCLVAAITDHTYSVCGVREGSVLGPMLFCALHRADLISLIESYGLSPHLYADDTQVYTARVRQPLLIHFH